VLFIIVGADDNADALVSAEIRNTSSTCWVVTGASVGRPTDIDIAGVGNSTCGGCGFVLAVMSIAGERQRLALFCGAEIARSGA
jgi:hypothetical protein